MEPEVITERLKELFNNSPGDNIEKLPEDIQEAIDDVIMESALGFIQIASCGIPIESAVSGAIAQAFFAGHEYAVRYGNLNAEMGEGGE